MTTYRHNFTLFDNHFIVLVKEKRRSSGKDRTVKLRHKKSIRTNAPIPITVHEHTARERSRLLRKSTELPPLGEHVAQVTNKGIQKWLREESEGRSSKQVIEDAVESTAQLWEENFGRAEEFN